MELSNEIKDELRMIVGCIMTPGKGILASDESPGSMTKKFEGIGIENNEENRRRYREMLYTADCATMSQTISGVIMHDETVTQKSCDGTPFMELFQQRGMVPGIKVDKGVVNLSGTDGETSTQGMDELGARCAKYKELGCHFAKWRCVLKIKPGCPSYLANMDNANVLAKYAAICQENRIVPIVEPEVIPDGDHDIERCAKVTETILAYVYKALNDYHVYLEGTLLKPNMVTGGMDCPTKYTPEQIAEATVTTFQRTVPGAVGGIVFLSGGQSEEDATINLNAINTYEGMKPWPLTFSYGRALQASALNTWKGQASNRLTAQCVFLKRCKANGLAQKGQYKAGMFGSADGGANLHIKDHVY